MSSHQTFSLALRFKEVSENGVIETEPFLDACSAVVPFFDQLGPTAFAPVKMDINGNIQKLRTMYNTDRNRFHTLQDLVDSEIKSKTTKAKNSGTDALLWLKRAMHFIATFLKEILSNRREDMTPCAKKAYEKTLKPYHGWLVSKLFTVALKAVPWRRDFMEKLQASGDQQNAKSCMDKEELEYSLMEEIGEFVESLESNLDVIDQFYSDNSLDDQRKV